MNKTLLSLLLLFASCKKTATSNEPPITKTGAGSFYFKANDIEYTATTSYNPNNYGNGELEGAAYQYLNNKYYLNIYAYERRTRNWSFTLGCREITLKNKQSIEIGLFGGANAYFSLRTSDGGWYHSTPNSGTLFIDTIDRQKQIVAGSFSCTAYDSTRKNIVNIKNGHFDLLYFN